MKTLVSLVSDQTIPNLELINEFRHQANEFWFFHSSRTREQVEWIIKAAKLEESQCQKFEIDAYDTVAINQKLNEIDFGDRDFILNITGGTKIWIMILFERFMKLNAEIYYLTGHGCTTYKMHPLKGKLQFRLQKPLTLHEYLTANGFGFKSSKPLHDLALAERNFQFWINDMEGLADKAFKVFQDLRNKNVKRIGLEELGQRSREASEYLVRVNYPTKDDRLVRDEIKYLSGEWLEEWVYHKLKNELRLTDEFIATGSMLRKNGADNEMDVMFVKDHNLYTIECKTAVLGDQLPDTNAKTVNILGETIYKSDSLRSKFGLFSQSFILTLSELLDENMKPKQNFEMHFNRAGLSRIELISRSNLRQVQNLSELIFKKRG